MPDLNLAVSINRSQRLTFIAGEDRFLALLFKDASEDLPLELTGARLTLSLPRAGGGTIKRRTAPIPVYFASSHLENGLTVFAAPGHGLVEGDTARLVSADPEAPLPAPFAAAQPYVVTVLSEDSFGLRTEAGLNVGLAAAADSAALLSTGDFEATNPALGQAATTLGAHVTSAVAIGQGLSYQVTYADSLGRTRFMVGTNLLDVFSQPCP